MSNKYRKISLVEIHEWTPNQANGKGTKFKYLGPSVKVFHTKSTDLDRVFGDTIAFMIEHGYPKTSGFSSQLMKMYFWEDIKRLAKQEAERMIEVNPNGNG